MKLYRVLEKWIDILVYIFNSIGKINIFPNPQPMFGAYIACHSFRSLVNLHHLALIATAMSTDPLGPSHYKAGPAISKSFIANNLSSHIINVCAAAADALSL